ncbi:MAG: hypothetical protein O7C60_03750, partial [Rickettsia endosymbiont of Ixodes persulcatus]|nr:hypothetical protein [Rickettsia endosymbiont of Ixodes persulcatus]
MKSDHSIMPTDERLLTMIRLSLADTGYRVWARENYDSFAEELRRSDILVAIQKQIEENSPPTKLPDGTIITADNSRNDLTFAYFLKHVMKDPDNVDILRNPVLEYQDWLNDTYGKTEWRKKVELADDVLRGFTTGLIKETISGLIGTVTFVFQLVVDPVNTTKEIV